MEQRKGPLGRGIASLISSRPLRMMSGASAGGTPTGGVEAGQGGYQEVDITTLLVNPDQPRKFFNEEKIQELAQSIREKGVLAPLIVKREGDKYRVISGERRLRAARLAGLTRIPVIARESQSADTLEIAIIENVQREDLDPVEESAAYQELIDKFQYTQEQVAAKVGKDRATVANMLRLLKLPTAVKKALQAGDISVGHARALLAVPEIERKLYLADQVIKEGWSVRELEARIAAKQAPVIRPKARRLQNLSTQLMQLLDDMRRILGTKVKLLPRGEKGKIVIEYYSQEDLNRVYKLLVN